MSCFENGTLMINGKHELQTEMPVLVCTDPSADRGRIITEGNFG